MYEFTVRGPTEGIQRQMRIRGPWTMCIIPKGIPEAASKMVMVVEMMTNTF